MIFTVYYRGQHITEVKAKDEAGAFRAYQKKFMLGSKAKTIFVPDTATVGEHRLGMQDSNLPL